MRKRQCRCRMSEKLCYQPRRKDRNNSICPSTGDYLTFVVNRKINMHRRYTYIRDIYLRRDEPSNRVAEGRIEEFFIDGKCVQEGFVILNQLLMRKSVNEGTPRR